MESSYVSFREAAQALKRESSGELKTGESRMLEDKENHVNLMPPTEKQATSEVMFGEINESFVHGGDDNNEDVLKEENPSQPTAENDYVTPNSSLLNDSLLVGPQGGGVGEVLHEIPVTPVQNKANRRRASPVLNDNTNLENMMCMEIVPDEEEPTELQVGDHVYQWRSWMGIPGVFQHHGIVMDVIVGKDGERKLTIADFSNVPDAAKKERRSGGLTQQGILRTYTDTDKWHKVHYEAAWWKRSLYRSGTCTVSKSAAVGLVLARVYFIVQHPDALPDYHVVHANCECVAYWCKTGNWSTLQASSFLEMTAAGQVKSTATLAGAATSAQVTVPAAGLWGWMGYTTQVSYLSMHPIVLPALAGYAVVTVGVPAIMYINAKKTWTQTSQKLSDAFWASALENPDVFAECITHWSDKR